MNKHAPGFDDVEQLLSELAQQDCQAAARDDAQTELMRGAARREIRRYFLRRRCLRLAGSTAMVALLGLSSLLLLPENAPQAQVAAALPAVRCKAAADSGRPGSRATSYAASLRAEGENYRFVPHAQVGAAAGSERAAGYSAIRREQGNAYELVIYAIPL